MLRLFSQHSVTDLEQSALRVAWVESKDCNDLLLIHTDVALRGVALTVTACYGLCMDAINKLRKTGLTTAEIADGVGCTTHAIRFYERGLRFPDSEKYKSIIAFAAARGIELSAADFIATGEAA